MRPIDSAYDRDTAEIRDEDPGEATYALVVDHNGPCSQVRDYSSLEEAISAARGMNTDDPDFDLEEELDGDYSSDTDGLIAAAQERGWRIVARAPAGEHWTVLVEDEDEDCAA